MTSLEIYSWSCSRKHQTMTFHTCSSRVSFILCVSNLDGTVAQLVELLPHTARDQDSIMIASLRTLRSNRAQTFFKSDRSGGKTSWVITLHIKCFKSPKLHIKHVWLPLPIVLSQCLFLLSHFPLPLHTYEIM